MTTPTQWVDQIQKLPVLPQVAMRITERIQSPTATLSEIANLIKSDVGLTSKILRLANSSYYSVPGGVADVSKALQYLGFTTIAQIVLTTSVFGSFRTQGLKEFPLAEFWKHSFAVGLLAEIAARNLQLKNSSDSFISGLMHDMGKLILLELAPEQLTKIVKHAEEKKISFLKAEEELGFTTHIELGVQLGSHWKLPANIVEAIQFHQGGSKKLDVAIVEWANLWAHQNKIGSSGNFVEDYSEAEARLAKQVGLTPKQIASISEHFHKEFEKAGAILNGN